MELTGNSLPQPLRRPPPRPRPMQPASFSSLPPGLVQRIAQHLEPKEQGRLACVSKPCNAAVQPLAPVLANAVEKCDAQAVLRLLLKPEVRTAVGRACGPYGYTPLHRAVRHGRQDILSYLLLAGAPTDTGDDVGRMALMLAANLGLGSVVESFLAAGASLETEDKYGWRALHLAAFLGICASG